MSIGEKIYDLRKKKNMSQEDLANVVNVSRQTVSKWETGESNPDFDKIVPLCAFFEITTDELLKGSSNNISIIKEPKKNLSLTISSCILIFWIMAILIIILEEIGINDIFISIISIICIAAISVILVNFFCSNDFKIKIENEKNLKITITKKIINGIIVLIYFGFSFIFDAWAYSWLIFIIGLVIKRIVELIFLLKEKKNEE